MIQRCSDHGTMYRSGCLGCQKYARDKRAKYRLDHPHIYWSSRRGRTTLESLKSFLVYKARRSGRKRGLESTIKKTDIDWPTICPVLGHELNYSLGNRSGIPHKNLPSLDRKDNTKGYVPGNVFVISLRANEIKRDATIEEMENILSYMRE